MMLGAGPAPIAFTQGTVAMVPRSFSPLGAALMFQLCAMPVAAAHQGTGSRSSAPAEVHRLRNGLSVVIAQDPTLPIVAVAVSYHVGVANEDSGRREFSHLFEHLMFMGSRHVAAGEHLHTIEDAGGRVDATTDFDRTFYYEQVPANYLETVLWLESDRMKFMSGSITPQAIDLQRAAIDNENRQRRVNAPYGMAFWRALSALYPSGHPYSLPTGNGLADLHDATVADVASFFRRFYGPNNATIAIVGDVDPASLLRLVERYFDDLPRGPDVTRPAPAPVRLQSDRYVTLEDQVAIPGLFLMWPSAPLFSADQPVLEVLARVLADGADSRLQHRLIEQDRIAQSVAVTQDSWALAGHLRLDVYGTPGHDLTAVRAAIDEEIAQLLGARPPTEHEVARAVNQIERGMAQRSETRLRRAMDLAMYDTFTGDADYGVKTTVRYRRVAPAAVQDAARRYLSAPRVVLSVVPQGQQRLQATP